MKISCLPLRHGGFHDFEKIAYNKGLLLCITFVLTHSPPECRNKLTLLPISRKEHHHSQQDWMKVAYPPQIYNFAHQIS